MISANLKSDKANNTAFEHRKFSSLVNETVSELTLNNKDDPTNQLSSYLQPSKSAFAEKQSSMISTSSPSFKPSKTVLVAENLKQHESFAIEQSLAPSQHSTSLDKMGFDLNNIKSFNPNAHFHKKKAARAPQGEAGQSGSREDSGQQVPLFGQPPLKENQQRPKAHVVNISE